MSPTASTAAPIPANSPDADEVTLTIGDRRYRLRGLRKGLSPGALKLNVLVTREGPEAEALFAPPSPLSGFFVDTLDLYSARQRSSFEKQAAQEIGVTEETVKRDLVASTKFELLNHSEPLGPRWIRLHSVGSPVFAQFEITVFDDSDEIVLSILMS